jgi:hypothetical protein
MVEKENTEGKAQDSPEIIVEATAAAERLEKAIKDNSEILKKLEAIEARRILGGQSTAGSTAAPKPSEEEIISSGAKKYFGGTIIGDAIARAEKNG